MFHCITEDFYCDFIRFSECFYLKKKKSQKLSYQKNALDSYEYLLIYKSNSTGFFLYVYNANSQTRKKV